MADVDKHAAITLFAGILCLLVIGVAGASLTSPVIYSADPVGDWELADSPLEPADQQAGNGDRTATPGEGSTVGVLDVQTCIRTLDSGLGALMYFGATIGLLGLVYRHWSLSVAMLSAYAILPFVTVAYFLLTACAEAGGGGPDDGVGGSSIISDAAGTTVVSPEAASMIMVAIAGIVLLGAAVLIFAGRGGTDLEELDAAPEGPTEGVDMDAFAQAAANAADRLEDAHADLDNEVYAAWKDMTRLLSVSRPETSTPGEFARAAMGAGFEPAHIEELTTLFEEVRYGHRDPNGDREERAIAVFRSIEREYGDDGATRERERDR